MTNLELQSKRKILGRLVFSFFFVSLTFNFFIKATPSHFLEPVLFRLNFDFTYWLYKLLRIPNLIVENKIGSILFDVFLLATCLLCVIYPLKTKLCITFACLFFLYAVSYNAYVLHHVHHFTVMTLITVPFFFKNHLTWNYLWEGVRYYVCYLYTMSFVWKAFIGKSLFFWNMGVNSLKSNMVEYIYYYPASIATGLYKFLIVHPYIVNIGTIVIFLLEAAMAIGFFTKKFDSVIIFFPIIIHAASYFFSDVFFFDMLIGCFTFLSVQQLFRVRHLVNLFSRN